MKHRDRPIIQDFKGIGYSKIGHFKEVRSKIKELERLNTELTRRHNKLEAIFNSMGDGLTIMDRDLTIVFANNVQRSMFPDIGMIGQKCHRVFFRHQRPCRSCPALRTLESGETLQGESLIRDGEYAGRYFEWTTTPIVNAYGKVEEIIYLMRDVTARKEYEFKLMESDRMAAVGFLAAGVAHEINNPLTSIAGFSEGLLKRIDRLRNGADEKTLAAFREYLEIIHDEAHRCKDVIRNLVDFSRKKTDEYETILPADIIEDALSLIRQHARDNDIHTVFRNSMTAGLDRIMGNESQLKHVFLSLFNKAFKTMTDGGELLVAARNDANLIEIAVRKGPVSQPFHPPEDASPVDAGKKSGARGSLSLDVCYNIVRHHNGELRLFCVPDSEFACFLQFPILLT